MIERSQLNSHLLFVKVLGLFAEWHEHEIPAIQTIGAAVGNHITGKPQPILGRMGEQMASAATVDTGDRFGWRLSGTRLILVLVIAHMFYSTSSFG